MEPDSSFELSDRTDSVINDTNVQIIKEINKDTVHRICSGQVIISVAIALKELIENSIDAGATNIDIRLIEYGSESIEVHDNGSGIEENNFKALAMKHCTSKLQDYSQLEKIATLGFRGEALSSLCALCDLTIVTRHATAEFAIKIDYDHSGNVINKSPTARSIGTTVTLSNLFSTLPVRRMEFLKNIKREFAKMQQLLTSYCIVCTGIKFTCNNKSDRGTNKLVLSTQGSGTVKQNIVCIFDAKLLSTLVDVKAVPPTKAIAQEYGIEIADNEALAFNFDCLVSSVMHGSGKNASNKQFFYINDRPCDLPKAARLLNEVYRSYNNNQYPFVYLNIRTISTIVDVNVTPDKREVFLEKEKLLLATLKTSLHETFKDFPSTLKMQNLDLSQKQHKLEKSTEIHKLMLEKAPRGVKRFLTDYNMKTTDKIVDSKRSKSFKDSTILNSTRKKSFNTICENVCTSTQMLDSFIEEAQKIISTKTSDMENDKVNNKSVSSNDNVSFNTSEKISCTLRKKSAESEENLFIKTVKIDSKSQIPNPGLKDVSKSIASVLEESGIEIVELTQSKEYQEILKYRTKVPLKITLQSIQEQIDEKQDDLNSTDVRINFRSNITPKCNADAEQELQKHITKSDFSKMEIIGQFNKAFMIVKLNNDLFIIDQHACDEKYNFEQLQLSTVIENQNMVRPLPLELSAANEELVMEYEKIFNKNGFFFQINREEEPKNRIKLTKIPLSKDYAFGKEDINEMLCLLQEDDSTVNTLRPSRIRMMFASRACRKSVMIGKILNDTEMRKLVNHMGEIEQPWNCPHGRPTIRHLVHLQMLNIH